MTIPKDLIQRLPILNHISIRPFCFLSSRRSVLCISLWAPTGFYHPLTLASLFFLFSILGWILETLSYLTMEGVFLNRSILLGPWIPLYGICGVLSVTMLHRFAKNSDSGILYERVYYTL